MYLMLRLRVHGVDYVVAMGGVERRSSGSWSCR